MTPDRAAEFIAYLTANVEHLEPSIAEFNCITQEDVALALSMVKLLPARLLARIKYADQTCYTDNLEKEFIYVIERGALSMVCEIASPQRWKIPRKGFLKDMIRLAIIEEISPKARLCWRCKGRGTLFKRGRRALSINCPMCEGRGTGRLKDYQRARLLGISPEAFTRSWHDRYSAIQSLFARYDGSVTAGVAKRLAS